MLGHGHGIATRGIAALLESESAYVANPLVALLADPNAAIIYLFYADPVDEAGTPTEVRLSSIPAGRPGGGYVTEPTDSPANLHFAPRLLVPYRFTQDLPLPATGQALGHLSVGSIVIDNSDRALDALLALSWEGRTVTVKIGGTFNVGRPNEQTLTFSEFGTLFQGTCDVVHSARGSIAIALRDPFGKLDVPIQTEVYPGTGGLEGDASVEGLLKPLTFGRCENIPPLLIDAAGLVYQFHYYTGARAAQQVEAVRDKGVALTPVAGGNDITDLALASVDDWTPVAGEFITDLAQGLIRLGSKPQDGQITADVLGDAVGSYVSKIPDIVRRVAVDFGGLSDPAEIEAVSFNDFPDETGSSGYYTGTAQRSIVQVISELLRGADAWGTFTREGLFQIGKFLDPDTATVDATVPEDDVRAVSSRGAEPLPVTRVRAGYQRMWAVQSQEALAGAVSEADRALYGAEFRYVASEATIVHVTARDFEHPTHYDTEADASADAAAMLARGKIRRRLFTVSSKGTLYQRRAGEVVTIDAPEQGLSGGKTLWLQAITEDAADRSTTLMGWG